ncbi:MAG: tape measure protein [Treponema sp.]|nr:tape measure protein [Treponema sp.]
MSDKTLELQIRIAAEEAARIVSALKGDIKTLADEAGKFAQTDGAALNRTFKESEAAAKESAKSINDIFKALGSLAEVVAATKALGVIKDMGAFALQSADSFKTAKNQFGILLQDMEAGAGLFNEIKAFGDVTPFDLDTLTQATNVLVSAKVPLMDLQDQLTKFGDLSQGNSQRFTSYIHAFSQASAKGKADMQVLNTYMNQGVPILKALAKNFGETEAEIMSMASNGKISFADFSRALDDLTAAGEQYFGGMKLASQSLAAMQEGLSEAVNTLGASFGDILMPAALAVVQVLTNITNAINESPLLKGLLIGAVVALTGYLAAMAVKAGIAFAAQMSLNFALGVTNPAILAATISVAALAAGYTIMAAKTQNAKKEAEDLAYKQRKLTETMITARQAAEAYYDTIGKALSNNELLGMIENLKEKIEFAPDYEGWQLHLEYALNLYKDRLGSFIKDNWSMTEEGKITQLNEKLKTANEYLTGGNTTEEERNRLRDIIKNLNAELDKLKTGKTWQEWFGEITNIDPKLFRNSGAKAAELYSAEFKRSLVIQNDIADALEEKLDVAGILRSRQAEVQKALVELLTIDPSKINMPFELLDDPIQGLINSYKDLGAEAKKIEDTEGVLEKLRNEVKKLKEAQDDLTLATMRAAGATDEQLEEFRKLKKEIEELKNEANEANFSFKEFFGNMAQQFASISLSSLNTELANMGAAFAKGELAVENLSDALANMALEILNQLPNMFLQAGLQLIAQGQWALGLGFIAAAGASAFISGFVNEKIKPPEEATKYAQGGIFDEYAQAARAFASGGTFTNQIVSTPTLFRYGDKFGEMGEAGPEAIMPLTRMTNGKLGVETTGIGLNVNVQVINNTGAEVRKEETERADGGKDITVIIGDMINNHISSGRADRSMSRFGVNPKGV